MTPAQRPSSLLSWQRRSAWNFEASRARAEFFTPVRLVRRFRGSRPCLPNVTFGCTQSGVGLGSIWTSGGCGGIFVSGSAITASMLQLECPATAGNCTCKRSDNGTERPTQSAHVRRAARPTAAVRRRSARRIAVVLRGEPFRWGCKNAFGIDMQRRAYLSMLEMIAAPLERQGHLVHFLLAASVPWVRLPQGKTVFDLNASMCNASTAAPLLESVVGSRLRRVIVTGASGPILNGQANNMREAFDRLILPTAAQYDTFVITRSDLVLLRQADTWACDLADLDRIAFASKCATDFMHRRPNCTSDLLHAVPSRFVSAFSVVVNRPPAETSANKTAHPSCCFHHHCGMGNGHSCVASLVESTRGEIGRANLAYCWPRFSQRVPEPNENYVMAQCGMSPGHLRGTCFHNSQLQLGPPILDTAKWRYAMMCPVPAAKDVLQGLCPT